MEVFKIDVSECTEDEGRLLQERLFKLGYMWLSHGTQPYYQEIGYLFAHADSRLTRAWSRDTFDEHTYPERPASDFLPKFKTRPHDYTGCDPDIAAALKRGEDIWCQVWDLSHHRPDNDWVEGYDIRDGQMAYFVHDNMFEYAKPIPLEQSEPITLTPAQVEQVKTAIGEEKWKEITK